VQADVVEPVYINPSLQLQLIERVKAPGGDELRLDHLERRFGHRIVVGAAHHAQGTADLEAVEQFVDQGVVEFAAPVGMEYLDVEEVPLHCRKGLVHQLGVFVRARAVPDNLSGTEIQQDADVCPRIPTRTYVRSLTTHTCPCAWLLKSRSRRLGTAASLHLIAWTRYFLRV